MAKSTGIVKMQGGRPDPCLVPFFRTNEGANSPSMDKRIEMVDCDFNDLTTATNVVRHPKHSIIFQSASHTNESKAFVKSMKVTISLLLISTSSPYLSTNQTPHLVLIYLDGIHLAAV